ncbi:MULTISPECIES: bifunctional alpha,alpha-trehalose-phosphate synthase (UDP-forming)/trehalose-phosphatase [unclassified Leeuwenhoekiella]|uniref:bifunctional alpha,alpha-trehalose-phosphate synthase (UDP-forming)/trehalose-phosphatase n=2 Tax=Leeuwenhoekiella TaxID=283735 RepID=UPI000C57AC06|nr:MULTISPECIES: bifunctional alpha,alpha-trehalose-phosphate synthase (UDP-forming)/trehalose-phosphatase [unclassified Leeuwenhoekiella]MAW94870.1 bifunctional alpha,alpha-trehalose-phosphate synthase (UDP-forming)/trehalose-phosphatase [Leeuwenhoekiella sp.]MBA79590.1 bifunctional alpha,alpha-trehalose-phosphate synthase (UDP-forming)/trehalose-phosphatase [Leeuwenhoekiella sp.]|tara:strand:+ start:1480 stop:3684 length:2205 start_codon:yes stop_codon:yes gene_type:complete
MSKTIIISNRLPLQLKIENQKIEATPSVGGLATGMKSVHRDGNGVWIGWTGLTEEEIPADLVDDVVEATIKEQCVPVSLNQDDIDGFYYGFSNRTIWPLFHYFIEYAEFEKESWQSYKRVNEKYAEVVLDNIEEGDTVWVHDYQLMLLPALIKKERPDVQIGFFLHIPFPSYEVFRILPWREEILKGLLGSDLIGFHTYDYQRHFLSSVSRILRHEVSFNEITLKDRMVTVNSFPMGIDYKKFSDAAAKHDSAKNQSELQRRLDMHIDSTPDAKMILSIDRLDYSKGIANRIRAYEYFLEKYPQFKEKVRLVMLAVPSRSNVPQYQLLKKEVDELVGRINGKFATVSWTPIWYFYRSMPFENLIDLYTTCEVALLTPIRDGMNLVAKEYVATRSHGTGVLILSEMAGAAQEMSEAVIINPNNFEEIADALKQAIEMPEAEQVKRNKFLQKRLKRYNVEKWAEDFMHALYETTHKSDIVEAEHLQKDREDKMFEDYKKAEKRILFLDYDGTLRAFVNNPDDASPDDELIELVRKIESQENTEVVIISGRDRHTLGEWWQDVPITLIAEHGVWKRPIGGEWAVTEALKNDWMETVKPILEKFVDRTAGTFIEEKNYSLAWHYRNADPDLGEKRASELSTVLKELSANNELGVLDGNKVLEIKDSTIHKGKAATKHIFDKNYDFKFAIGDDWTDEYMFQDLPEDTYSVKVGLQKTAARFYVDDTDRVRDLLKRFANN